MITEERLRECEALSASVFGTAEPKHWTLQLISEVRAMREELQSLRVFEQAIRGARDDLAADLERQARKDGLTKS